LIWQTVTIVEERHVRAFTLSLRKAIDQGGSGEQLVEWTRAAIGSSDAEGVMAEFYAWQEARVRYLAVNPDAPEEPALRREVDRLWAACEAAVGVAEVDR
jgi:hypothetical protein